MTAYELACSIYDNDRTPDESYRMTVEEAENLLKEYSYSDDNGELAGITAEDLANEYNEIVGNC